jgi:hypothetical protein
VLGEIELARRDLVAGAAAQLHADALAAVAVAQLESFCSRGG